MNNNERTELMEYMGGLWPDWEPSVQQKLAWDDELRELPLGPAKEAASYIFKTQSMNLKKPNMLKVLSKARENARAAKPKLAGGFPAIEFRVMCIAHPDRPQWVNYKKYDCFIGHERDLLPTDLRMPQATRILNHIIETHGGEWIITFPESHDNEWPKFDKQTPRNEKVAAAYLRVLDSNNKAAIRFVKSRVEIGRSNERKDKRL